MNGLPLRNIPTHRVCPECNEILIDPCTCQWVDACPACGWQYPPETPFLADWDGDDLDRLYREVTILEEQAARRIPFEPEL